MIPVYTTKPGLTTTWKTSVGVQKIDSLALETYDIVSVRFSLQDNLEKIWFFKKTFLLADTSMKVVLGISFFSLSNANFLFDIENLTWRSYIMAEALSTTT